LVPLKGVTLSPTVGIILGGTMTAVAVAARRSLDTLTMRSGEVAAALGLGPTERDARKLVIERATADALLPNVDQARTAGLVTLEIVFICVTRRGAAVAVGAARGSQAAT
jgi:putative ABC transport system permease protein